jgi:hypothetical protein
VGTTGLLSRVLDQREETLKFFRRHGLEVGARISVVAIEPAAGTITVARSPSERVALSDAAARAVMIQPLKSRSG